MISEEEGRFYQAVKNSIKEHPEWIMSAMQAIQSGMEQRLKEERHQKAEWETVAMSAMDARLFGKNKNWLAQKIDRLRDGAAFKWDFVIERLQK